MPLALPSPTALLLSRQIRLQVSPPTTTLSESRSILSYLQSRFGPISTFLNERNDRVLQELLKKKKKKEKKKETAKPPSSSPSPSPSPSPPPSPSSSSSPQTILLTFQHRRSKLSALAASHHLAHSPLQIPTPFPPSPGPREQDPYNARGMRGRHYPASRVFDCWIIPEEEEEEEEGGGHGGGKVGGVYERLMERHAYTAGFRIDGLEMSYGDLMKGGVERGSEGMGDVMQVGLQGREGEEGEAGSGGGKVGKKGFYSRRDRERDPGGMGGLMAAWRWGVERREKKEIAGKMVIDTEGG